MNAINKSAVFALFDEADSSALSFGERMLALGIGSRGAARPLAIEWAGKKYGVPTKDGQRGLTLSEASPKYATAKSAAERVLAACFPTTDLIAAGVKVNRASDNPVEKLLKAYAKLSAGEKRSFKAKLSAL